MNFVRHKPRACLAALAAFALGGATLSGEPAKPPAQENLQDGVVPQGELSILTYNVKGLPAPVAIGRAEMLDRIGDRLAAMRKAGSQPSVVVLQEAFTPDAQRIADAAGYRHVIFGPQVEERSRLTGLPVDKRPRSWMIGETQAPQLSSGLMLLSDFPVITVSRSAFPRDACAGFDCLANKGILFVTLDVPGKGPIAVATTHLNSRSASLAPDLDTHTAYAEQADYLAGFVASEWDGRMPLIVAGDFNRGQWAIRKGALKAAFERLAFNAPVREGLGVSRDMRLLKSRERADSDRIVEKAKDMQFIVAGRGVSLLPTAASVPFGSEPDGTSLSDHFGFVVSYRFVQGRPDDPVRLAKLD